MDILTNVNAVHMLPPGALRQKNYQKPIFHLFKFYSVNFLRSWPILLLVAAVDYDTTSFLSIMRKVPPRRYFCCRAKMTLFSWSLQVWNASIFHVGSNGIHRRQLDSLLTPQPWKSKRWAKRPLVSVICSSLSSHIRFDFQILR